MDVVEIEHFGTAIICPYNKSHVILAPRMQRHLIKCRRQHPTAKIEICRFNASHHVPEAKMKTHESNCPDRVLVEHFQYQLDFGGSSKKVEKPKPKYNTANSSSTPVQDENWDDMDTPPYDPQAYCKQKPVVRSAMHKTRAEKRQFYAEEQARFTAILKEPEKVTK